MRSAHNRSACGSRVRVVVDRQRDGTERLREGRIVGYWVEGEDVRSERVTHYAVRDLSGFLYHKPAEEVRFELGDNGDRN